LFFFSTRGQQDNTVNACLLSSLLVHLFLEGAVYVETSFLKVNYNFMLFIVLINLDALFISAQLLFWI
jgi:hypothetical protein